jgi:hypothetical protein
MREQYSLVTTNVKITLDFKKKQPVKTMLLLNGYYFRRMCLILCMNQCQSGGGGQAEPQGNKIYFLVRIPWVNSGGK